jgi:hypothetical protein
MIENALVASAICLPLTGTSALTSGGLRPAGAKDSAKVFPFSSSLPGVTLEADVSYFITGPSRGCRSRGHSESGLHLCGPCTLSLSHGSPPGVAKQVSVVRNATRFPYYRRELEE